MSYLCLAGLGLICFLGYDVWTVRKASVTWPKLLFWAGLGCDLALSIVMLCRSVHVWDGNWLRTAILGSAALICLALLIYTLFFALSFDSTYVEPTEKRPVCRRGMYALCRHPGVVWFILFYLALYLALPSPAMLMGAGALCIGNIIYILVQDLWSFPNTFTDYADYRREVPFLIPTPKSIRRAIETRPRREFQA